MGWEIFFNRQNNKNHWKPTHTILTFYQLIKTCGQLEALF